MPPDKLSSPNARSFAAMGGESITLKRFLAFFPRDGRPRRGFFVDLLTGLSISL